MSRWWLICAVVAGVGLVLTVLVIIDPALSFAFNAPELRAVLETAVTIVGGLVAFLAFGRYRAKRQGGDLAIALALAILALDYPLLKALPALLDNDLEDMSAWLYLMAHACSAGLLCWASGQRYEATESGVAMGDREPGWRSNPTPIYSAVAAGLTTFVLLCFLGFDPDATKTSPAVTTASQLFVSPGVSAVRLLCFALFIVAAVRFSIRARAGADALMGWLSVGCVLLAIGDLEYGLFPPLTHSEIHLGDAFRLAAVLVFAVGATAEIRWYWYENRELAKLAERKAVAIDLHDGIAQELAFLSSLVHTNVGPTVTDQWLRQLRAAADRALAESRRAISALAANHPIVLRGDLDDTLKEITSKQSVPVELDIQSSRLEGADREVVIRIVREAVLNAVRHGRPNHIRVSLCDDRWPTLKVMDDGSGFDPSNVKHGGFGLVSMQERAKSIGAHLNVESAPGRGTTVEVSWAPLSDVAK